MIVIKEFVEVNSTTKATFALYDLQKNRTLASCECQKWEEQGGWLMWVHVHPDHRRQGLGLRLLELVLDEAREAGKTGLGLAVRKHNKAAIALYKQLDFAVCYESGMDLIMTVHLHPVRRKGGQADA